MRWMAMALALGLAAAGCERKPTRPDTDAIGKGVALAVVDQAPATTDRPRIAIAVTRNEIRVTAATWADEVIVAGEFRDHKDAIAAARKIETVDDAATHHLIDSLDEAVRTLRDPIHDWVGAAPDRGDCCDAELYIATDVPMERVTDVLYTLGRAEISDTVFVVKTASDEQGALRITPLEFGSPDAAPKTCTARALELDATGIHVAAKTARAPDRPGPAVHFGPRPPGAPADSIDCHTLPAQDGGLPLDAFRGHMKSAIAASLSCDATAIRPTADRLWKDVAAVFAVLQVELGQTYPYIEVATDHSLCSGAG